MSRKTVSDHAVIRYLECVDGVDIIGLKQRIEAMTQDGRESGSKNILIDGMRFRLSKSGCVKTVHKAKSALSKKAQRWHRRRK